MSQRVKRPNRSEDGSVPVKRRKRTAAEEEEAASLAAGAWQPPRSNDLKSIYNRTTTEAPAELFRKDLISAMKLPDSEPLALDEYWVIVDQWKQEWERGVQVPVNPDSLPEPSVTVTHCNNVKVANEFKLPKNKYIRITKDDNFKPDDHSLSLAPAQSEAACSYDLDECDVSWLRLLNSDRASSGLGPVYEDQLERVIERFEVHCWEKIQSILRDEEGLGIEYDENVICDVCRSPDSEEGNEMVFCDSCNICVHQACYGITRIPEGQWLCCTCNISKRPECVLCPHKGGAMKCTRSGQKWAHVSCALWIPEVSIGCVEKMEPITKISSIPASRWALICVLCRERVGACIQCSVKTCKTAYHVTCAFKHGLEMRAIIEDENADDGVKLRSYCEKHSKSSKKEKSVCSGSENDDDCKRKKRKDMTSEEKNQARAARLQEIEAEFYKHVAIKDVTIIDVDIEALQYIYNYWKLKRKAGSNKPLLLPKSEDVDMLSHKREQADLEKMKMFVQLRQDLERVRNLCYMVSRREKLSRTFFRMREQTFHKQAAVFDVSPSLPTTVSQAVIEANHGPSIYDRLYSHSKAEDHMIDFDTILARISGNKSPVSGDEKKPEINGLFKDVKNNPYKKEYFNGSSKRRSCSLYGSSLSSASSSDERPKDNKENRLYTSSEDEKPPILIKKSTPSPRKPNRTKSTTAKALERKHKKQLQSRSKIETSSEEDVKPPPTPKWGQSSRSRLMQVENELGESAGSESDELMPIRSTTQKSDNAKMKSMSSIYSDSDDSSTDVSMRNESSTNDSQSRLRTKAAVKEFSHKPSTSNNKSSPEGKKKVKQPDVAHVNKKKDYVPSDLIVPQRQAAKKATENLKSNTSRVNKEVVAVPVEEAKVEVNAKPHHQPKVKVKASSKVEEIEKEVEKDPEILAFVPQRQAAKKAAEHIKSGLGKPNANAAAAGNDSASEGAKKEQENAVKAKKEEVKASKAEKKPVPSDSKRKSSSNSSSSSSSSTSSSTSSSSSSESEEDRAKPQAQPRLESLFSPSSRESTKRSNAKDWPFLDKVSKTKASSSSSDSSDSSAASSPTPPAQSKAADTTTNKRKTGDTKQSAPIAKREELARGGRGRAIKSKFESAADRVGDVDVRIGDSTDKDRSAAKCRKSDESSEKEIAKSDKLRSPPAKADKKVKSSPEISNLEKEILERKAGKEGALRTKSTLDRLFGSDKKNDVLVENAVKADRNKSPQKITKEEKKLPKKSPLKTNKSIDDIFANKIANSESKENKVDVNIKLDVPKISKASEEITLADKIVEDHLQLHKSKELYNSNMDIKEFDFEKKNATKHTSTNVLQNRSIFSPQPHSLDFDHFDDNFGISKDDEIMKGPLQFTFNNSALIKEDTKEDSARETLNLVEKLRMEYSKKSSSCDVDDVVPTTENDRSEYSEQVVPQNHISDVVVPKLPEIVEPKVEVLPKQFPSADHATYLTENKTNIPLTDHSIPIQGDERWVPPSESYPNIQSADPATYLNDSISIPHVEPYVAPPPLVNTPILPQPKQHLNSVLAQLDVRLHEEALKTQSPLLDRRILQTPLMDPASMDMPSPSPYGAKWTDSELMPNRRSSSSSAASSSSSSSRRNDQEDEPKMIVNHPALEMSYLASQVPHVAATAAPVDFSAFSEASQFVSPVSLFHPTLNTQLPFPPTGFPPQFGAPFPTPHTIPSLPKPVEDTTIPPYSASCTAAFTSSQHNMALTAAMVNLPPAKIIEAVPEKVIEVPKIVTTANPLPSPSSSLKSNSSVGKKSPTKPTRTSARVTSQVNKSPMTGKSPGKSPRQEQVKQTGPGRGKDVKRNSGKVNSARSNQNQARSRGRGRGRGRGAHHDFDFIGTNTIHNKLVGTVYDLDFDDDISNDNMMSDLKSMRERRKSSDFHDRKFDSFSSPNSPKFSSPTSHKNRNYSTDLRELRPPTPIVETDSRSKSESINSNETETTQTFPDVTPVLPGPVDMRTYNSSFDQQSYNESNLLSAFASGTTVTQVHEDIDEDFEKELHTALGKKPVEVVEPIGNIKVSLSDSRNQLKVKIKGPIANYTSTVVPLPPPTVDPIVVSNMNVNSVTNNAVTSASRSMSSGSIWRVRKKELLRQYCSQDLNATDEAVAPVLAAVPQVNRTIITIPKAVASMTSIPTKDDYRDYRTGADDFENKHHKKIRPGLSRELRQLESSMDEKNDAANKRRGRPPRPSTQPTAPKLKIKIGSTNSIVGKIDDKKDRIRPPKKRCLSSTIAMPTVEDLKRDSMKFRKMVMADLKVKKKKKEKGEKRKKKNKTKSEVQIISNQCENPTKLIIRFGKKAEETTTTSVDAKSEVVVNNSKKPDGESAKVVPSDASANVVANAKTSDSRNDKVAPVVKLTPIKLKLSRCQAGSGYVMKAPETKAAETIQVPVTQAPPPLPINKDCEVR